MAGISRLHSANRASRRASVSGRTAMRIAFISYAFAEYCVRHANGLSSSAKVMLMIPRSLSRPHLALIDPRVDFRPFDMPRLRQPVRQLNSIRGMMRKIRDFKPDVIHFQLGHLWFNMALPFLKRYPLVFTIHDPRHHLGDHGSNNTPQWIMDF